jgi:hypothetical protein
MNFLRSITCNIVKFYCRYTPISKGRHFLIGIITPFVTQNQDIYIYPGKTWFLHETKSL